ncbi:hypothetical protein CQW23_25377 [Capsicum baccatum]|uniref:FBD domain-containing protein n=1 Tax=Capsicum baccatum TaxID=33114 RepID=A0A2G2VKT5_CAPBA|nr:hypothetical protein CQW23_25377 [Capsicum baccatum]
MIQACDGMMRRGEMRGWLWMDSKESQSGEVALLETKRIDKTKLADVLATASLISVPVSLAFPVIFCLSHASVLVENITLLTIIEVESADNDIPPLESLEVERFSDVTFNRLRKVKLMQTNGTIPERQLIKLLLAKSPELVKMLIEPCLVEESATVQIFAEIRFQRASPNAEVVYKLDKHPNPRPVCFSLARMFSEVDGN